MKWTGKRILKLLGATFILGFGVFTFFFFKYSNKIQPIKHFAKYGAIPYFKLVNQLGDTVTVDDLKGYIWITDFIFTNCPGMCPRLTDKMKMLQDEFHDDPKVKFVSITVDPERDSVAALMEFAAMKKANMGRWWFLTGSKEELYKLSREGFKLAVMDTANGNESFTHSEKFTMVDTNGEIRGYYNGTDSADVNKLIGDIQTLSLEKIN